MAETKENPRVLAHGLIAPASLHSFQLSVDHLVHNPLSGHPSAFACALPVSQSLHLSFYIPLSFL